MSCMEVNEKGVTGYTLQVSGHLLPIGLRFKVSSEQHAAAHRGDKSHLGEYSQ